MKYFLFLSALIAFPVAQMRVIPLDEAQGHVALGLALRHLANTGIFMHTTAHPDDENNGLLVMLNRGQGYRTALATATRGNGGQNEIGPELFEALGVLRTGELASLHRFDGAEQYFTRAVDFGYSFGIEETFEKWGRAEITADYVRLIRTIRPDVIITLPPTGNAGGQHHMASAVITRDAYKLAADPTKPEYEFKLEKSEDTITATERDKQTVFVIKSKSGIGDGSIKLKAGEEIYARHHEIMERFRGRELGAPAAEAFVRLARDSRRVGLPGMG